VKVLRQECSQSTHARKCHEYSLVVLTSGFEYLSTSNEYSHDSISWLSAMAEHFPSGNSIQFFQRFVSLRFSRSKADFRRVFFILTLSVMDRYYRKFLNI